MNKKLLITILTIFLSSFIIKAAKNNTIALST